MSVEYGNARRPSRRLHPGSWPWLTANARWRALLYAVALFTAVSASVALVWPAAPAIAQTPDDEIVYLDLNGAVRVADRAWPAGSSQITWFSPRGGYTLLTLIDLDHDGDQEIAVARPSANGTSIDFYDPVVTGAIFDPNFVIGGIPWRYITTFAREGQPSLLAAGNLDNNVKGAELLFVEADATNPALQRVFMLRNVLENGSSWDARELPVSSRNWNSLALGDMDADGLAEIGLSSTTDGTVEVWKISASGSVARLYSNPTPDRPWLHVAMGDWLGNGKLMLGAVRDAPAPFPALVIYRLIDNGTIQDYHGEAFHPSPHLLFFGDVNASGDDEVFMLRSLPISNTADARLFARNRGSDVITNLEVPLDVDSGYRIGIAGDFDGDSRDEVAVLRDNNLRIFLEPHINATSVNVATTSDTRNVAAGDLDRAGHIQVLEMGSIPTAITGTARSGELGSSSTIRIINATNGTAIPIEARVEGAPAWVSLLSDSAVTTATLSLAFDATRLPPGKHTADLLITSSSNLVQKQPLKVPITLLVGDGLLASPNAIAFISTACAAQAPLNAVVQVSAPAGTSYVASLVAAEGAEVAAVAETADPSLVQWPSSAPWLSASSAQGVAPEAIALRADFAQEPDQDVAQASVVLVATVNGVNTVRTVPVTRLCAVQQVWMPLLIKQ